MVFFFYKIMQEEFRTIEGFENYQISNLGRVKSLKWNKEKILKPRNDMRGYYKVNLYGSNGKQSTKKNHQLVAVAFLNHKTCGLELVINHKDFDKLNNHVENLEIVTMRENSNLKHIKSSSQYVGVFWDKKYNKWRSKIVIKGKHKHLGYFTNESEASEAYQKALVNIR